MTTDVPRDIERVLKTVRRGRWWGEPSDWAPFVTLAAIVVFFALTTRGFLQPGTLRLVLQQGAVLAIVSVGLTFVLICGEIDLSVGMVALWTACACGVLFECPFAAGEGGDGPVSWWVVAAVIAAPLLSSLLLGLASGVVTVGSRLPSFIITLALMNIADGMARWITNSEKFAVPGILKRIGNDRIPLGGGFSLPYSVFVAAAVLLAGHLTLKHTRFGRFVYMTGGNREAARLAGVRTSRIVVAGLAICGWTAGIGGLVNAGRLESVTLDQNADLLLSAVACVVLGGTSLFGGEGGIGRTLIGVLTYSVLQVGLNALVVQLEWDDRIRPFLMGLVLLGALVLNGILARRGDS
ncbi:MAG: ABC transporter permease [Planctomycetes bacterium]|nr:ABC transporter permease [Planctomycetota bacterium]